MGTSVAVLDFQEGVMRSAVNSSEYLVPIAGFSQMIVVPAGSRYVVLSGLTARTFSGEIVGKGDMTAQTEQVMQNMQRIVAQVGATLDDVIQIRTYVTDISQWDAVEPVWQKYWGAVWPVSTMVQISRLFNPDQMIEIEATVLLTVKQ